MFSKQIFSIYIVIIFFAHTIQSKCEIESPFCSSCNNEYGYYKVECKSDRTSNPISVFFDENEKVTKILCQSNAQIDDYHVLPALPIQMMNKLIIYQCPINENFIFRNFLDKLNITTVYAIDYTMPTKQDGSIIKGDLFESMENTTELVLKLNDNTVIDSDLLKNFKELLMLVVRKGRINLISNFFENTPQIKWIEFGDGNGNLPANIFKNLYNLKFIQLWSMNISILNESIFHSQGDLHTLDLSGNNLETLPETIFERSRNLSITNLSNNHFISLPGQIFQNNKNLTEIKLCYNYNSLSLSNGLFSNLPNLKTIFLTQSHIINVSEDIFWNSSNIFEISLNTNDIQYLPEMLFRDTIDLKKLDLSENQIINIPENLFQSLENLEELNLSDNQITSIPEKLFQSVKKLEKLDLSYNQISSISDCFQYPVNLINLYLGNNALTSIDENTFPLLTKLKKLDLKYNQLSFPPRKDPFNELLNLEDLDLSHNNITSILNSWLNVITSIKYINLAYNQINRKIEFSDIFFGRSHPTELDLSNNLIHTIDLATAKFILDTRSLGTDSISGGRSRRQKDKISISNNPINCNCFIHDLVRYFKRDGNMSKVHDAIEILAADLKCAGPKELKDLDVTKLQPKDLFCEVESKDCPTKCNCKARKSDYSMFVDCSNSNLTNIPPNLPQSKLFPNIKLFINNNKLSDFNINKTFAKQSGYQNVRELYIQNNRLSQIEWLPNQLQVIKLHSNRLTNINITLLQNLSNLRSVTLHNNPWKCDCNNLELLKYIQQQAAIIGNISDILCDEIAFYDMDYNKLCPNWLFIWSIIIIILLCVTIIAVIVAYFRNKVAVHVWMYKHKICLCCVRKLEKDEDKEYDAFVCYAHQDDDFVQDELIPNLEECENPFKLCIHSRDWLAGDMIPDQIARAVSNSRRTLVILSPHLLESSWAIQEFRAAHKNALDDRTERVIIIKLADVDKDKLFPEIESYLKLNTYIEWGHKRFWDNLRYALPHREPLSIRAQILSKQIKKSLGDTKLDELHSVTSTQPISTIPQVTLSDNTNNKNPFKLRELLNNLQKQIVLENSVNRNIA